MRSSSRAAAVVELFVRAVVAERKAREARGEAFTLPPEAQRVSLPPINVWRVQLDGVVH